MTDTATTVGTPAADDVDEATNKMAVGALIPLLIIFILGTLCLQGFNLVFQQVGADVGAPGQASLITALPSIVLGIVCFIYGSLGDFVSLRKLVTVGLVTLLIGSLFGFIANYFFQPHLWTVITARVLQTAGEQVAGSAYLVVATKYLRNSLKVIFFGLFTAGYQLSAAIGVFAAGLLSSLSWQFLFLIPSVTIFFLPLLLKNLPAKNGNGKKSRCSWLHGLRSGDSLPDPVLLLHELVAAADLHRAVRRLRRIHQQGKGAFRHSGVLPQRAVDHGYLPDRAVLFRKLLHFAVLQRHRP
jgi:DHA2 family metal-tetracycline-proton antiporter-like MFS transporter